MPIGQRLGRTRPAVAAVVTVSVEVPLSEPGVTVGGLKVPVAPGGSPETLSVTALVKLLPTSVTVMGYVADAARFDALRWRSCGDAEVRRGRVDHDRSLHLRRRGVVGVSGLVGVDDQTARGCNSQRATADRAGGGAALINAEDNRITRSAAGRRQRNLQARGIRNRRSGLGEIDGLWSLIDDHRLLHLRRSGVSGVAGLVGINDKTSDAGDGERAAGNASRPGTALVDGEDDWIPRCASGGDQ